MLLFRRFEFLLPSTSPSAFALSFVAIAGLGLGILLFEAATGRHSGFAELRHDGYWELAGSLARGHGYVFEEGGEPVLHRPPLVPAIFGPLTLLPDAWQRPGLVLLQSLMLAAVCGLTFDLIGRVLNVRAARGALLFLLAYPFLYFDVKDPLNIVTQTACVAAVLYLLGRELLSARQREEEAGQSSWLRNSILLGLAATGAILTHGTMLLAVPLLIVGAGAIGLWLRSPRVMKVTATAALIVPLAIAPWTYRNWQAAGRFMPVVGGAGLQYFVGVDRWEFDGCTNSSEAWKRIVSASLRRDVTDAMEIIHFWGFKDPALEEVATKHMVEHIRAHPDRFAMRIALNAVEFYAPSARDVFMPRTAPTKASVARRAVVSVWHLGLLTLAAAGLWRSRKKGMAAASWLAVACVVILAGGYLPFVAGVSHYQYCLQTLPLLAFLTAVNVVPDAAENTRTEARGSTGSRQGRQIPRPLGLRRRGRNRSIGCS